MRQRIALGSMAVTVLLGLFLVWQGLETKQLSAMERMAENIRKAKSYKYTEIVTYTDDLPEPGKPSVIAFTYINYGESNSFRSERFIPSWKGTEPEAITINSASKPCIRISNSHKTYSTRPPISKKGYFSDDPASLDNLGNFSGSADRELGTKEIDGKKARGFEIGLKKIRPDSDGGLAEIWIDVESNLPIQVRFENPKILESSTTELFTDIQWNIDIDPKLFDTTPPEGYADATEKTPTLEEQLEQINLSLQIYAEASGGHYPRECPDFFTTESLCKLLGLAKWPTKTNWPTKEDEEKAARAAKAIDGFSEIAGIPLLQYRLRLLRPNRHSQGQRQSASSLEARRRPVRGHLRRPSRRDGDGGTASHTGRKVERIAAWNGRNCSGWLPRSGRRSKRNTRTNKTLYVWIIFSRKNAFRDQRFS